MNKKLNYEQAVERLDAIVNGLEEDTLGVDELSAQLREAQELLKFCKERLTAVENDVNNILNDGQG